MRAVKLRAMTRDKCMSQELVVTWSFMLVGCCGTVFASMESSVFAEQSWLQFVVAMGIASCIGLVHGKLCIG